MTDHEIHWLRSKCQSLENQTRQLEVAKLRLQSRLDEVQDSLVHQTIAGKTKLKSDLINVEQHYIEKFETAARLLKFRLQWELAQALQHQKEQLQKNFRSDLFVLTHRNTQLATMLSITMQKLQQNGRVLDEWKIGKRVLEDEQSQLSLAFLRQEFERQTNKLLKELNDRENTIRQLQHCITTLPIDYPTGIPETSENSANNVNSHSSSITSQRLKLIKSAGPVRNKIHRNNRISHRPYTSKSKSNARNNSKYASNASKGPKMNELAISHPVEIQQSYYSLPSNLYYNQTYYHPQYAQCGGSGLETLPEASSEEESLTTVKDDALCGGSISTDSQTCQPSSLDFSFQPPSKPQRRRRNGDFITDEREDETHKILSLESIIHQLKEELRESKDQNELLEFRLLEIEEVQANTKNSNVSEEDGVSKTETSSDVISHLPLHEVVTNGTGYGGNNSHTTVTESRSSCSSDCSESLSLQESGIFDGQGSDDGFPSPPGSRTSINRELANLTFQIEELLRRYNEGSDVKEKSPPLDAQALHISSKTKTNADLTSDLSYCRQRIQEFEKRLSQMNDINYMRTLEEKVNCLIVENKRIEEERTEIEEAENDNRYLCQRLEEKVSQLKKKKLNLQGKLNEEKARIEDFKQEIMHVQSRNGSLSLKISKLEALLQNYEQRNFELEETCMEMRCSIQFVIHSMPIFSLCYFWYQLRTWSRTEPINFFKFLMNPQGASYLYTNKNIYMPEAITWNRGACGEISSASCNINMLTTTRKHKLAQIPEVEPIQKKWKSLKGRVTEIIEDDWEDVMRCNNAVSKSTRAVEAERMSLINAETQTGEELWKIFSQEMPERHRIEWKRKDKSLREMEAVELDIDKMRDVFNQERSRLIEMYESKLGEKEAELKESRQCQNENRELQEKWNCLIQELEQFAMYLGKNLYEKSEGISSIRDCGQLSLFSKVTSGAEMVASSGNASPRIGFVNSSRDEPESDSGNKERTDWGKADLIQFLQSSLNEHLIRFERREQQLLCEIDRLVSEMKANADQTVEESNIVSYLTEENQRLQALFKDHDKVWGDFKQVQEENEKLRSELSDTIALRKRLEESQRSEGEFRERLEELERVESSLRNQLGQMERKEQKGLEKIQQLRDEIQFLRSKCCQLQDDVDGRVARETKYKNEIQLLVHKLRESTLELEEKETQLESNENTLQTQIAKLRTQLQELYQTYTDTECSNGMLKEEVSYLEKTVEEALSKGVESESTITALSHELKQKDSLIEELQTQLRQLKMTDSLPLSPASPHELSEFNSCEGGLHGVVRAVEEVVSLIQKCSQCESVSTKLMEIVERLIPLIQILKSSHVTDFHFATEPEIGMTRCESDEILICPKVCMPVPAEDTVGPMAPIPEQEEDEVLIGRLHKTMAHLTLQITKLEENLNIRQAEMKESHAMEMTSWKHRCEENNRLIQLLARRIAHLSVTDAEGHFVNGILTEIRKLEKEFDSQPLSPSHTQQREDCSFANLRHFLTSERQRIMELFEGPSVDKCGGDNLSSNDTESEIDFRVVRKIGDDALLVSWTMPESFRGGSVNGYEIAVNGSTYLRIPKPNRHKAVLFGLNLDKPLRLTFKCPGDPTLEESSITFIS